MATSTILRDVNIKEKHQARSFIRALENAENKAAKKVELGCSCEVVKGEKIRNMFEAKK